MSTGFVDNVKGFLLDPIQTLIAHKDESLGDALWYFVILLAIYGALNGIIFGLGIGISGTLAALSAGLGPLGAGGLAALGVAGIIVASIILFIIFGVIGLFIGGIILHIFVYIAGGRKDVSTTLRAIIYSYTPKMLFGWVPLIGFFADLWTIGLAILAIRELHEISTARAVIAVILPIILMIILAAMVIAAFIFSDPTITPY
ncbi:YIP1 family protein [Methanogenium cariaci]|jgi:hypothetical protein